MTSSTTETAAPLARRAEIRDDALSVELVDGRTLTVPLTWYPRLWHAAPSERNAWRLIGGGSGIQWPALDEDVSVEGLLLGRRSAESQQSLKRWMDSRLHRQP